jgi:hypothetical protein
MDKRVVEDPRTNVGIISARADWTLPGDRGGRWGGRDSLGIDIHEGSLIFSVWPSNEPRQQGSHRPQHRKRVSARVMASYSRYK